MNRTANGLRPLAVRHSLRCSPRWICGSGGRNELAAIAAETAGSSRRPRKDLAFHSNLREPNLKLALQNFEERELNAPPLAGVQWFRGRILRAET